MRMLSFKSVAALGAVALLSACSDGTSTSHSAEADNACVGSKVVAPSRAYSGNGTQLLIEEDGFVVKTFDGENFGLYIPEDAAIYTGDGQVFAQGVLLGNLTSCPVNATYDPSTGEILVESSSSSAPDNSVPTSTDTPSNGKSSATVPGQGSSSSGNGPTSANPQSGASSSGSQPGKDQPGQDQPGVSSSSGTPAESSSSDVPRDANGFPTLESYGPPPEAYTKDILSNGKTGWSSRYWDACKPHCSWLSSVDTTSEEKYQAGGTVARNCNIHDVEVPAFTLGHAVQQYWMGYEGTNSACVNNNAGGTYTCTDMAPIQVTENLSYGYVAAPGAQFGGGCGKCFHLQFNGGNHANDVKETHKALKGKHMIVMASNIGYDVEAGQYDMLVPGGGVGAFNALSTQIGVPASGLGANGGGFMTECQQSLGWDNTVEAYQECVLKKCDEVFKNWPNLLRGCRWYAEWYMTADNPTYNWEEVECPQYLVDHYLTTFNTTLENRWRWHDDWSDYKKGDVLDTVYCWKDGENPKDPNGKGAGCEP